MKWKELLRKDNCALLQSESDTQYTEVCEHEYEHTPTQMAEKLLEFNRDFSDSAEDIQNEKEHVVELFEKLQNSNEFNILAHYLDTMFMDEIFNK